MAFHQLPVPDDPAPTVDNDILFAIQQCENVLEDDGSEPRIKAVFLSWLIHLRQCPVIDS
jgi:hypothetical protein